MKRISQVILIFLGMIVFLSDTAWAQTGSLEIDVDIPATIPVKEQTFFEQDAALKQLFDISLSQAISKKKTEESLSASEDMTLLFLSKAPEKLNPINTEGLFLTQTTSSQVNGVTLRVDEQDSSVLTVGLIGLGLLFSGVSIYQFLKKRKASDYV